MTRTFVILAVVAAAVLSLSAAVYNGYPFLFSDSYPYIKSSITFYPPVQRPVFYGYLIFVATTFGKSLWSVVFLQTLMLWYVAYLALRRFTDSDAGFLFFCAVFLTVCSGLPWAVGQLMPDGLTGVLGLSMFVLIFRWRSLATPHRFTVGLIFCVCLMTHLSHYPIVALAIVPSAVLLRLIPHLRVGRVSVVATAVMALLSAAVAGGVNRALTGSAAVSGVSHAFIMGRLAQDGIIYRLLRDHCGDYNYALCPYKEKMFYATPDSFLWGENATIRKIGGWTGSRDACWTMILDSLKYYPGAHLISAIRVTGQQFMSFSTGQEFSPFRATRGKRGLSSYYPSDAPQVISTRQINGKLSILRKLRPIHYCVAMASFLILLLTTCSLPWCPANLKPNLAFAPYSLIFLISNAAAAGIFSGVYDRYQSRVVWIAPLAALVTVRDFLVFFRAARKAKKTFDIVPEPK